MTIIKRADLGRPLTWDELDDNFQQVDNLTAAASAAVSSAAASATAAAGSATNSLNSANSAAGSADDAAASATAAINALMNSTFEPSSFDFTTGGTLDTTDRNKAVYNPADNNWYSWSGTLPKIVSVGEDPTADTSWKPRTDQLLRQELATAGNATGANMIAYQNSTIGSGVTVSSYLDDSYILVKSRDEIVAAASMVNTLIKTPVELRLSRNFEAWTAPTTDIDFTWIKLKGSGGKTIIDASGIPNVEGNYWLRAFNSGASNINNLNNLSAFHIEDIFVLGPGLTSLVDCVLFNDPEGGLSGFNTSHFGSMGFRTGDKYQNNAYIIKHCNRTISRCANLVWMPSGYSNYGEAIEYHGSTLSTASGGIGVRNDNANGAIRFFGGSIDYVGRVAIATAGRIELNGTHIEFNNSNNQLTGIPFETSTNETAEIVIDGGEILGYVNPLPAAVTTIFRCGAGTNGITLNNVKLMKMAMATGNYNINDGTGPFKTNGVKCIDGSGNPLIPMLKSDTQNLIFDPNFTQDNIVDWYISADTGALTSRTAGVNLNLTKDTTTFRTGGSASMKVSKIYGIGSAADIQIRVPIKAGKLAMYELFVKGEGLTGTLFVNAYFASSNYNTSLGVPVTARAVQVGPTRSVAAADMTDWARLAQQVARYYTPEWATHLVLRVQLSSLSAGTINIDDVKVTEL